MIVIKREASWADRLRKYKVILDEREVGTIEPKGTFEYQTTPGIHTLYLKIDWCRSKKLKFDMCAASASQSLRTDAALMFLKFQTDKLSLGQKIKELMQDRGWLKTPPFFHPPGTPTQNKS